MENRFKSVTAVLLALSMITACGSDDAVAATDDTGAEVVTDGTGEDTVTDTGNTAAYIGNWTTGCIVSLSPVIAAETYLTYELQFDETNWQFVQSAYLDEGCTILVRTVGEANSIRSTTTIAGTYIDAGELTTTDGLQAKILSITVDTLTNTLSNRLDEPDEPASTEHYMTTDVLVHVDGAGVLYFDDALLDINNMSGTLVLTLPFDKAL